MSNLDLPGDLNATGADPGSTYTVTSGSGIYREDRSIAATGQMFRVYGAAFTSENTWELQAGASAAYATVQDSEGDIHYYTLDTATGTWVGSDNNTVYNAVDYGLTTSDTTGDINTPALQAALHAVKANGGIVFIPAGTYQLNGGVSLDYTEVPGTDVGIIIAGAGGNTTLNQNDLSDDTFSFTSMHSGRGARADFRGNAAKQRSVIHLYHAALRSAMTLSLRFSSSA